MNAFPVSDMRQLCIEKLKVASCMTISESLLSEFEVKAVREMIAGRMVAALQGYVYSKEVREEVKGSVQFPATWVQALKERWLPRWILRRYPVRYSSSPVRITHVHVCPHINVKSDSPHIYWLCEEPFPQHWFDDVL